MDAYTNDEIRSLPENSLPGRGPFCERCQVHLPQFADLTTSQDAALRVLASQSGLEAMKELRRLTACDDGWAKIWLLHPNGPQPAIPHQEMPCPYCGKLLCTDRAKQCLSCGMDWHNPDNVVRHGNSPNSTSAT
jgi:hypothetical protein